ncbi:MAG: 16S rRNA (cytosine(1402)-N(4))-methyltransferase [Candidatus Yanofskybacteria bacterium RIFCSPHIGHO2_01_FULL_42_12]|uniref:Ribosomal RNA small subunit methyltransferase H n=1 Tax=Candidatus Yanofskybacteria bacterium RIFCSPLOWO2_01_FULL_42_49 TaxID=1802694 RepID=A0A1F8GAT9_9BACT|nr:MAG: 16S rRNA (cytosine(1402)-N(4))-methyltransferase [Candidatus Yanofskybacteria bacterium RIFCSPHIGHO2_01_FULL_42_12]OGN22502.1 MAG: 16S rRNA (cytosine(1402)-N(4))-methyltransferase [Candidatus Yanofskybacteria bacterium RIFCSPLOWO2_01_FULL_42_49]
MVHNPVLLKEVIEYLDPKPGDNIIDATLDGGGHSAAILEKIEPNGKILGIEIDPELVSAAKLKIKNEKLKNLIIVNDSYINIEKIVREHNFRPNGILFDLGLSSWHYERSGRGFSFKKEDEPLDMRYNPSTTAGRAAAEIVNTESREELERIFEEYGEEQFAESIAKNIISARKMKLIMTVGDLVEVIKYSVPDWYKKRKIHFATKTFQALRIAANEELKNVSDGVSSAVNVLIPGGRLAVISFHGLEDKIIRELFKRKAKEGIVKFVIKGTVKPSWEEIKINPRARSAKLKIIEKI